MIQKPLQQLYQEHQGKLSDKWSLYLVEYERLFSDYRNLPVHILEIGIQNGGSLEIWARYFTQAEKLVGCDINPDCHRLRYDDPRISVVVGDANLDETEKCILGHAPIYDLIIDDGSHRSSDIIKSFARYFPYITDGGMFVAEDLHCSYWQEYEGGLFDSYSSITFFKRLADVVSHEHWGVNKTRQELLAGFARQYGVLFNEEVLSHIHSIEFINSICVIRKSVPANNQLGLRVISGRYALVESEPMELSDQHPRLSTPDQSSNFWSIRRVPPDEELVQRLEELTKLNLTVAERDEQIANLNQAVAERDRQIANLNQAVAERDEQIASLITSTSWQITKPLRFVGRQIKKTLRIFGI